MKTYTDRLVRLAGEFEAAYRAQDWTRAKLIYDKAVTVAGFLELPREEHEMLFGHYDEENDCAEDGLFEDAKVHKVMKESIIKNSLGFECMVYRVPGEVGYHGAAYEPGARPMSAEENPAYSA